MTNPQKPTLLGMTEMAELYGVSRQTATGWRRQTNFPKPIADLAMGPVWDLEDLKAWREPPHVRPSEGRLVDLHCAWCGECALDQYSVRPIGPAVRTVLHLAADCNLCGETTSIMFGPHKNPSLVLETSREESK